MLSNESAATRNRATLQVARKLVAYLLAVDKNGQPSAHSASAAKSKAEKEKTASGLASAA